MQAARKSRFLKKNETVNNNVLGAEWGNDWLDEEKLGTSNRIEMWSPGAVPAIKSLPSSRKAVLFHIMLDSYIINYVTHGELE
jgi:hypothetical protein